MHTPQYAKHTTSDLTSFSRVMAGFFGFLTGVLFWHHGFTLAPGNQITAGIAVGWLLWGLLAAPTLKPFYHAWMWLAFVLNFIMTRVILGILFFGVMLPISLVMKITGKDFLGMKEEKQSYWKKRDLKTPNHHFEKLYTLPGALPAHTKSPIHPPISNINPPQ